jgi:hypothetical protein
VTAWRLSQLMIDTPRFGSGFLLRDNVMVTLLYNGSMLQQIDDWKSAHRCEASYEHGARILRPIHSLNRLAVCKITPMLLWVVRNDVFEAARQLVQIQTGVGSITEDARKLAYLVYGHHLWPANVIMVGHSQGNLLISQALSKLPSIDQLPTNVGDNGCTAVLTLASPIARSSFPNIDQHYVRGLTVDGDILLQLGLPNDFDVIHTPAGDSVQQMPDKASRFRQGLQAHFVDENYLHNPSSSARVSSELVALSDECSAGSFTIAPNPITMAYGTTMRITPTILNRAGRPLVGRKFHGGPLGLDIRTDSIATASLPTHGTVTGTVTLENT